LSALEAIGLFNFHQLLRRKEISGYVLETADQTGSLLASTVKK
jgi:hypothetical protein